MLKLLSIIGGITLAKKMGISLRNRSFYMNYARGSDKSKHGSMKHYHMHQDYEIFYMIDGEKQFFIHGQKLIARKNNVLFINKNTLHKSMVNSRYERLVINFRDDFLMEEDRSVLHLLFQQGVLLLSIKEFDSFQLIIEKMLKEYYLEHVDKNRYLQLLLSQLLIECSRNLCLDESNYIHHKGNSTDLEVINRIIFFINENYDKPLTLSSLSEQFYMHEQTISKQFKQIIGCHFTDYVNAVRITEAKRLLIETNLPVQFIAKKVGYSNHVHFWRIFKHLNETSPKAYRKTNFIKNSSN